MLVEPLNLRKVAQNMQQTKTEKRTSWELRNNLEAVGVDLVKTVHELANAGSQVAVLQHLEPLNPGQCKELKTLEDEQGFKMIHTKGSDNLAKWLSSDNPSDSVTRSVKDLFKSSILQMRNKDRRRLYGIWTSQIRKKTTENLKAGLRQYAALESSLKACNQEIDLRCL